MSRNIENMERELKAKAYIYNTLINTQAREEKTNKRRKQRDRIRPQSKITQILVILMMVYI
jgi:hypothetical protein